MGKETLASDKPTKNRTYELELAQRGYVVIASDYPSHGACKYDFRASRCDSGPMKRIFNHIRCVDPLHPREEVAPKRIATIGQSLGGHNAIFLGVFRHKPVRDVP